MFLEILSNNQGGLVEKALETLLSWLQSFKYQLLENSALVLQVLRVLDEDSSELVSEKAGEVLVSSICQSKSADLHTTCQISNIPKQFQ